MQSRRDQVEAQSYLLSRLTSALLRAEPDGIEPPTKRDTRALIGGVVVTALALGGVALWALFSASGSTAWRAAGTLIVDKSTGSRFLLVDGQLRPVLNLASARLVAGSSLKTATVASKRLKDVPRGDPIGIDGAPDMLPAANLLNRGVWRVCLVPSGSSTTPSAVQAGAEPVAPAPAGTGEGSTSVGSGSGDVGSSGLDELGGTAAGSTSDSGSGSAGVNDLSGRAKAGTVVQIGAPPATDRVKDDEALFVTTGPRQYLIWRGQRLAVERSWAPDVLGFGNISPARVTQQWVDLLPPGPALAPAKLSNAGKPGPVVAGKKAVVGQIFRSESGGAAAYYLTLSDGLAPMTDTQYALASAEPRIPAERPINAAQLAQTKRVSMPPSQAALPAAPPAVRSPGRGVSACLEYPGAEDPAAVDVVRWRVPADEQPAPGATSARVAVTPNGGGLVGIDRSVALKDQPQALIDDAGTAYPLADGAIGALGFSPEQGVIVPAAWLLLLPHGPLLSAPGEG